LGGYGLALAALALVVFGAYDSYLVEPHFADTMSSLSQNRAQFTAARTAVRPEVPRLFP